MALNVNVVPPCTARSSDTSQSGWCTFTTFTRLTDLPLSRPSGTAQGPVSQDLRHRALRRQNLCHGIETPQFRPLGISGGDDADVAELRVTVARQQAAQPDLLAALALVP